MIERMQDATVPAAAALAARVWTDASPEALEEELRDAEAGGEAACFLLRIDGRYVGFAQCELRRDYVEGTASSPVAYLEGIYVEPSHRLQGLGRQLVAACEAWGREQGCTEFASDCELTNLDSLIFHLRCGFGEANRIICFTKGL